MRIRHMVVSAVAFAAILGNAPLASGTATPADPPAIIAPSAAAAVKTCVPREIVYDGIYRIDNDLFAGSPGQSCVVAKGGTVTITNCSPGDGPDGAPLYVTRYPKVYVGQNYTSGDPRSGLPVKMTRAQKYSLRVKFKGTPTCKVNNYIDDLDVMFSDTVATADQHPTYELVIAGRWDHGGMAGCSARGDRRVSIAHHWYCETRWMTHTPGTNGPYWPLVRLVPRRQFRSRRIRLATFMWHMHEMGLVPANRVLDMVAAGTECWGGCGGLSDSMSPWTRRHRRFRSPARAARAGLDVRAGSLGLPAQ
jgi:hypothetical protein